MIRLLSCLLILASFSFATAQTTKLKRKYRGLYQGEIPSYNAIIGSKEVSVKSQALELSIDKDSLQLKIGKYCYKNSYVVIKKENTLEIRLDREDSGIEEVLVLDTKAKTLTRKGLFPQPDAVLTKPKKSAQR
jgi:hypothetical protein